jgi:hypothetical protein
MARKTKTMSGSGQTNYFRELFLADPEVGEATAARLAAECEARIAQIRVRSAPLAVTQPPPKAAKPAASPAAPAVAVTEAAAAKAAASVAFDPFAFSVVALYAKKGKLVLEAKLADIHDAGNLRAIADAQHLGIAADVTEAQALRTAIVAGAERRMADRKAAAS